MPTIKFDLIQRFEVENGVPRLVSTNIQVLEGGEDLMSLATSMLAELGCNEVFEQNRTSQYVGYRLKNAGKGAKRYQLVLAQRKEGLYLSVPENILQPSLLKLKFREYLDEEIYDDVLERFWVRPSKEDVFLQMSLKMGYGNILDGQSVGNFNLDERDSNTKPEDYIKRLNETNCWLRIYSDKLFPYTSQVSITSIEVLEEVVDCFIKLLMENQ